MNEQPIKQALQELAKQEVNDDMDLWPIIQSQLQQKPASRIQPVMSLARVAAAIAIFLTVGMVSYAVYQNITSGDAGLDAVRDAGLITELGLSQTVGDVTVTLDWAYADVNRIAIEYTMTAPGTVNLIPFPVILRDASGYVFPGVLGGGGGGGGDGVTSTAAATMNFDTTLLPDMPEELNLHLEITVGTSPMDPESLPPLPEEAELVGTFGFDFTLPLIAATIIEPMQTVTANDIPMTLVQISLTPSMTRAQLCYNLPGRDGYWIPFATLDFDHASVIRSFDWDDTSPDNRLCAEIIFALPYPEQPSVLTLTVDELYFAVIYSATSMTTFRDTLAESGIEVTILPLTTWPDFMPAGATRYEYEIMTIPEGVDSGLALSEAWRAIDRRIEGPWVFEVDIP